MKNKEKIILGVKNIWRKKWKIIFPITYLLILFITWNVGKTHIPEYEFLSLPKLNIWIFNIFLFELAVVGIITVLILLGSPLKSKEIESRLLENGIVNHLNSPPKLLSVIKNKGVYTYELFSRSISISKYLQEKSGLETALNKEVFSIEQGRDKQHVIVLCVKNKSLDKFIWKNEYISEKDFELMLGKSQVGIESIDISSTPHTLIGGGTGSGKTNLLKLLLVQCLQKEAIVKLCDLKGGVDYSKKWHEKCEMITTSEEIDEHLTKVLNIMEERRKLLVEFQVNNIHEYNKKSGFNINRIIVACDEIAEVLDKTGLEKEQKELVNKIESKLSTIARQGRAFGIHLIFATQRPDADILKGQIKSNIGYRICGRADKVLSQIILDCSDGAEKISQKDQGMFLTNTKLFFKAFYVEDDYLEGV